MTREGECLGEGAGEPLALPKYGWPEVVGNKRVLPSLLPWFSIASDDSVGDEDDRFANAGGDMAFRSGKGMVYTEDDGSPDAGVVIAVPDDEAIEAILEDEEDAFVVGDDEVDASDPPC